MEKGGFVFKVWDPWYDLSPSDCNPGECNYDSYRRFVGLKQRNPNFRPMISVGMFLTQFSDTFMSLYTPYTVGRPVIR